ncbi:olfactory receptor 5AN1-like [Megalops cyprinoides]|uniref:olfactory receptor 5AN1-like n=1 Tax=Megalops cyprinoides TaxID=118141 RepID=UPI001864510D|nr:olfactory receptor 5AN1-like [Megalops cyprinoides]
MNTSQPVSEFIIVGLSEFRDKHVIMFVVFLLAYMTILGGNLMIIYLVRTDSKLNSPMYFFLHNLSFVDIVYTSVTIPNMLSGFLTEIKTISTSGCFLQMYWFISMAVTGRALLTVMAFDRYVAICNPLRYTAIMTRKVRVLLIFGAWGFGMLCTLPTISMTSMLPFCGPKHVQHCFCDPSSVMKLACDDISFISRLSLSSAVFALLTTLTLILSSYVVIGVSIVRMGSSESRRKAFTTCAAHLTVVSISYVSASFVYISYRVGNFSSDVRIIVAVLYSALTPLLNPMIYSLRNKELRDAVRRVLCRRRAVSPQAKKIITTLS